MTVMLNVNEHWRPVPYYPNYEVSNTGKVRRTGKDGSRLPVFGSGAGRFVKIKDRKGRAIDRNLKSLVEAVFHHPIVAPRNDSGEDVYNEPAPLPGPITKKKEADVAEEWLPVLLEGVSEDLYEISDKGRVRKTLDGLVLKSHGPTPTAARWVSLRTDDMGQIKVRVDQLVLEAFNAPNNDPDLVPIHRNGDRTDSRPKNLRWGTREEAGQGYARVKKSAPKLAPATPPPAPTSTGTPAARVEPSKIIEVEHFSRYRAGELEVLTHPTGVKLKGLNEGLLSWEQADALRRILSIAVEGR
jgi:hypothetical protein